MMSKRSIIIILIITSLSVLGFIGTQLYWIRNAVQLSEQQFDHRVTLALRDVFTELEARAEKLPCPSSAKTLPCPFNHLSPTQVFDTSTVDSLLRVSFVNHSLDTLYYFRVVRCKDNSQVVSRGRFQSEDFPVNAHKTCMSCFNRSQRFSLEVSFPGKTRFVIIDMLPWMLTSLFFLLIGGLSFAFIASTIVRQKKVSEMKNDFINNMTHEFKTPLSTISMAAEVLMKSGPETSQDRLIRYAEIISDETSRLKNQVERVLQMAVLEKSQFQLSLRKINLNDLIQSTINQVGLQSTGKPIDIKYDLHADPGVIWVDPLHFANIISNLYDNSCKYSKETILLVIRTENWNQGVRIIFEDNGIGMSLESQKLVFDKFYRVPTGNLHDVKGFGLGLYYMKTMVLAHGGTIQVESELGKGTRFILFFPLNQREL
jgi:two-component system phosphate regulon sensor histidine kinase PhoR